MKHTKATGIPPSLVKEWFDYTFNSLVWKISRGSGAFPGKPVGTKSNGILQCSILGERHNVANVVWCWHFGVWPQNIGRKIVFLNGDKTDTSIQNLSLMEYPNPIEGEEIKVGKNTFKATIQVNGLEVVLGNYSSSTYARIAEQGALKLLDFLSKPNPLS